MAKSLITCDCLGTQQIDSQALSRTTGLEVRPPCSALCTTQIDRASAALQEGDTIFCCTQESRVFEALAEELDLPAPPVLDLRDRAGWSADSAPAVPKMSALIAEALLPAAPEKTLDVISEGLCLILGAPEVALPAAEQQPLGLPWRLHADTDSHAGLSRDGDCGGGYEPRASLSLLESLTY